MSLCILCKQEVRDRQQALRCEPCCQWQHRVCDTGISQKEYRLAVKNKTDINWQCASCRSHQESFENSFSPAASSTAASFDFDFDSIHDDESDSNGNKTYNIHEESMEVDDINSTLCDPSSLPSFAVPIVPHESDIADVTAINAVAVTSNEPVSFELIKSATKRGKNKLLDSYGFSYNISRTRGEKIYWQCVIRSKTLRCRATVIECDGFFDKGVNEHNHPPTPGAATIVRVTKAVKDKAKENIFQSANAIVNDILINHVPADEPVSNMPQINYLARAANRARQRDRPCEPTDLQFDFNEEFIGEGFLQEDIRVNDRRHLVFATKNQLKQLGSAKTWYCDATFNVVRRPFTQLFSINAFVQEGDAAKQVPLVYVLMSGKNKGDYWCVLDVIKKLIPDAKVEEVMLDFERAAWRAFADQYPNVKIQGCSFHWAQAVWRKVQEIGLAVAYSKDDPTQTYIRRLLALPYLPAERIPAMFERLEKRAKTEALQTLCAYIQKFWIDSTVWCPSAWSVFMREIRTNNDIEGWHNALNRRATKGDLPFYVLILLLSQEAKLVSIQMRLVSARKLRRVQRKKYKNLQKKILKLWNKYLKQKITTTQLLKETSQFSRKC